MKRSRRDGGGGRPSTRPTDGGDDEARRKGLILLPISQTDVAWRDADRILQPTDVLAANLFSENDDKIKHSFGGIVSTIKQHTEVAVAKSGRIGQVMQGRHAGVSENGEDVGRMEFGLLLQVLHIGWRRERCRRRRSWARPLSFGGRSQEIFDGEDGRFADLSRLLLTAGLADDASGRLFHHWWRGAAAGGGFAVLVHQQAGHWNTCGTGHFFLFFSAETGRKGRLKNDWHCRRTCGSFYTSSQAPPSARRSALEAKLLLVPPSTPLAH